MRESIGSSLDKSLLDRAENAPVVRIAALAKAPRLGSMLWRLKYGADAACYKTAALLHARRLPRYIGHTMRRQAAETALREWLSDLCHTCLGAREMMIGERRVVCGTCNGLGMRRYSDRDRGGGKVSQMVGKCLQAITAADLQTAHITAHQLERC